MGARHDGIIRWNRCRGRNGFDPPDSLPDDMAAEAINVILSASGLCRKRFGCDAITNVTFPTIASAGVRAMIPFFPGQTVTGGYLIVALQGGEFATITSATEQALTEANTQDGSRYWEVCGVTLNGKCYVAYNSDENRLHVFHPAISTTVLRRSGLETPAAATVANTGAGAYPAVLRYYRIQWRTLVGGLKQRASNLGASVSFTPSGGGTAARVTQPSPPGEGETHWVVYASSDNMAYYELSGEIVIATTTYDDSTTVTNYDDGDPAPLEGAFTPWPSVKFLATDGERLLGFGVYETSQGDAMEPLPGRVYFSPVLDTSDYDDDERVSDTTTFKGWIDIGRNVGAEDRSIHGPINGEFVVGQSVGITLLIPTGDAESPYQKRKISTSIGVLSQWSSFIGEDETGAPCLYFLDPLRGPMRYGVNGFEWLGYDVQDIWQTANVNTTKQKAHGVWYGPAKTALWWVPCGSGSTDPTHVLVFDTRYSTRTEQGVRYGWTVWSSGDIMDTIASVVYPSTLGTGDTNGTPAIFLANPGAGGGGAFEVFRRTGLIDLPAYTPSSTTNDAGTNFYADVTSKAWVPEPGYIRTQLDGSYLRAKAASGVTITQSLTRNYGDESNRTSTVSLTAAGSETRIMRKFENSALTDADAFQVSLGDNGVNVSNNWTLDAWIGLISKLQEK